MPRGRKPKPTKLKILAGNPGKRPLNANEPQPASCIPECPEHLDVEARKEWERVTKELDAIGLVSELDRAALAGYCVAWSRWAAAEKVVNEFGAVLQSEEGGYYQNPHLSVANRAMEQMRQFCALFGLDPSSRSRLGAGTSAPANPFEALLNAKKSS